ncbi:HNH endonuclease [Pseudomonas sp. JQ36]
MLKAELLCRDARRQEVQSYLKKSHATKKHISKTVELLTNWAKDSKKNKADNWPALSAYTTPKIKGVSALNGAGIKSAFRDFLSPQQEHRCCYCRRLLLSHGSAKPIEHILPRQTFPQFSLYYWNLSICCADCNRKKGDHAWGNISPTDLAYPRPTDFEDFFHPRFHEYNSHVRFFRIETNGTAFSIYRGITPQGKHLCLNLLRFISAKEALCTTNPVIAPALIKLDSFLDKAEDLNLTSVSRFINTLNDSLEESI